MEQIEQIWDMINRGEEHIARATHGDAAVDRVITQDLEDDGYDFDACLAHANGFGH